MDKQLKDVINEKVELIFEKIVQHRRQFHSNPELSCCEYETADYITETLNNLGIKNSRPTKTSVVGIIGEGLPCVGLRADIDALPIEEETGLPYASLNKGVMHACGHDLHTAMLLGAAEVLMSIKNEIKGTIKLIFQHSEELLPGGAIEMIRNGVLSNPEPQYIFGQHIDPFSPVGNLYFAPGPVMASSDEIYWTMRGKGSHAAQPHLGQDPIMAAAELIRHYPAMLVKHTNPLKPVVLSVTSVHGGSATNIFPDEVKMQGTLRTFDDHIREDLHKLIIEQSKVICSNFGVECEIIKKKGYPPLVNDNDLARQAKNFAADYLGNEFVHEFEPKMWAEDFAYFAKEKPSVFWFLGAKESCSEGVPLHNSILNPSEKALFAGTGFLAYIAVESISLLNDNVKD